jgi:DNA-binding XRE family transcriptional regulator
MKTNHKPPQNTTKRTFRQLSVEQRNAISLLTLGKTDQETADTVGVSRETVWSWRNENPRFMAELDRARAEIFRVPHERLRSLLAKAIDNIAIAVEEGSFPASIEVLKAVGMYGDRSLNAIAEQDPDRLFDEMVLRCLAKEKIPDKHDFLLDPLKNPRKEQRREEIEAELWAEYGEAH